MKNTEETVLKNFSMSLFFFLPFLVLPLLKKNKKKQKNKKQKTKKGGETNFYQLSDVLQKNVGYIVILLAFRFITRL